MAVPAPAIPSGNAYTVHVAHAPRGVLPGFAVAAAPLLRRWKIPVRMHLAGHGAEATALRAALAAAGARASAFSPAPSADVPGEGFWKTTLTVVEAGSGHDFWTRPREDRKVEWEPLLIALGTGGLRATLDPGTLALPDLWCLSTAGTTEAPAPARDAWMRAGAAAVAVLGHGPHPEAAWGSRNAVFGNSEGICVRPSGESLGSFAAAVAAGLLHDLLGENLFDKTTVRIDRECLEMRPLRLGRACGAPWNQAAAPWPGKGR